MNQPLHLSIVIPAYNECESLPELCQWIERVVTQHQFAYEVIIVDDGSSDDTWRVVEQIGARNPAIKGIRFRRNYGKSAALHVGFRAAEGKVVITMDADMQDSPDEIPALYQMITRQGYDLVSGWKKKRYDPRSKTIPTKLFNAVTRWVSGIPLHDFNCGLKAYRQEVVKSIEVYGEMHRYIPLIAKWAGFKKIGEKVVEHRPRKYGATKFGPERFVHGFLDLMSILFVGKFRKRPMHFFGGIGLLAFLTGGGISFYLVLEKFIKSRPGMPPPRDVVDQPLFFLALTAAIIGTQLFLTGFLAEMVLLSAPNRNDYLIAERINFNSSDNCASD
ncbi:MAG: glycosyltransferase family 2 protein [Cytophagales bacterium]|nr:glycosyltransferase family 2 protein [Bernardetiaceae bacterium]MDW8211234.1 glycosyltransferase family 2 protein [Cytophagales bacterium]